MNNLKKTILGLLVLCAFTMPKEDRFIWPKYLSAWNIFDGGLASLQPVQNVIHYEVKSPLYSDYAHKQRLIILPDGTQMTYKEEGPFDLPEGTIIVKSFYYPRDFKHPDQDLQIMETRLMVLKEGEWKAASYEWNDIQTDARIAIGGSSKMVSWHDQNGKKQSLNYVIPNANQCTNCHVRNGHVEPIGINARQLNHGTTLYDLAEAGLISEVPHESKIPKMPDYRNTDSGDLNSRARAYLDANCAHCHRPEGPANSSGLYLQFTATDEHHLGVMKSPVAAGRGSGGKKFNIVPGKPKASILLHRMESDDPGVRMPEIGRQLPHEEGVQLIRDWIKSMK